MHTAALELVLALGDCSSRRCGPDQSHLQAWCKPLRPTYLRDGESDIRGKMAFRFLDDDGWTMLSEKAGSINARQDRLVAGVL